MLVVINKMDSVRWSESRFEATKASFDTHLIQHHFKPSEVNYVPVSSFHGENIVKKPKIDWYSGPTLLQSIVD